MKPGLESAGEPAVRDECGRERMRRSARSTEGSAGAWSGLWVVDKPSGMSSLDVSRRIKSWAGPLKMGHTGTLDPMASGVLPILVGNATRLLEYLPLEPKRYLAGMELGVETDTWDASGRVVSRNPWEETTPGRVEEVFADLEGQQLLPAPAFSAIKHRGRPLYVYARKGRPVLPAPRPVFIRRLTLLNRTAARVDFELVCGRGTYVRAVVQEVGKRLGCGACLVSLRRQQCGSFALEHAYSLTQMESLFRAGNLGEALIPPYRLLEHLETFEIDEQAGKMMRQGHALRQATSDSCPPGDTGLGDPVRVLVQGKLLAVAKLVRDAQGLLLQPVRVLE